LPNVSVVKVAAVEPVLACFTTPVMTVGDPALVTLTAAPSAVSVNVCDIAVRSVPSLNCKLLENVVVSTCWPFAIVQAGNVPAAIISDEYAPDTPWVEPLGANVTVFEVDIGVAALNVSVDPTSISATGSRTTAAAPHDSLFVWLTEHESANVPVVAAEALGASDAWNVNISVGWPIPVWVMVMDR